MADVPHIKPIAGYPLTKATTAWGALRIVPGFALGCALYLARRASVADSRKALAGAVFFTIAVITAASFQAPVALIVSGFGGLIITLAQVSKAGWLRFSHRFLVYLGQISCSVDMVCIAWELRFVNAAAKIGDLSRKQLPPMLWLVFLVTVAPLAAVCDPLIEKAARQRMKLWRRSRAPHDFATAAAR